LASFEILGQQSHLPDGHVSIWYDFIVCSGITLLLCLFALRIIFLWTLILIQFAHFYAKLIFLHFLEWISRLRIMFKFYILRKSSSLIFFCFLVRVSKYDSLLLEISWFCPPDKFLFVPTLCFYCPCIAKFEFYYK
jgi:hypothetical protein